MRPASCSRKVNVTLLPSLEHDSGYFPTTRYDYCRVVEVLNYIEIIYAFTTGCSTTLFHINKLTAGRRDDSRESGVGAHFRSSDSKKSVKRPTRTHRDNNPTQQSKFSSYCVWHLESHLPSGCTDID